MNRRQVLPMFGLPFLLAGCQGNTFLMHFRMDVEVEADGKVYVGSSLMRLFIKQGHQWLAGVGGGFNSYVQGEAVVVEIGDRGVLFVTLRYDAKSFNELPTKAIQRMRLASEDNNIKDDARRFEKQYRDFERVRATIELTADEIPILGLFRNINDPTTGEILDPKNLSSHFGRGVRLNRITITMTDPQPITREIEKRLIWLNDPSVMKNPGWDGVPEQAKNLIIGLKSSG